MYIMPNKRAYPQDAFLSTEDSLDVPSSQSSLDSVKDDFKVFQDSVHGPVKLDSLLVAIIDTPQYQRLRDIKQLGSTYWVYPGACHNRFEHGIGTSYLCGLMLSTLRELHNNQYQDHVEITDSEILCIKVAGLCHDMGHGPFSHAFDGNFLKSANPVIEHEDLSCKMFDYMLDVNPQVREIFLEKRLGEKEIMFIKRLIRGCDPRKDSIYESCIYLGQHYKKWFLYEILANKRTGIDCDKFDYFARDTHHVGLNNTFNHVRFFQNIRILPVNNQLQICIRDKEVINIYELFHVRWLLHRQVYQHKTVKVAEEMIFEALKKVDKKFDISLSLNDMEKYTVLTDSIIYDILRSKDTDSNVVEAKELIMKLQKRQLHHFCGQINPRSTKRDMKAILSSSPIVFDKLTIAKEISDYNTELDENNIFVNIVYISFGMHKKNPVEEVFFFNKHGCPLKIRTDQLSDILPKIYEEQYIRVYCKEPSKENCLKEAFHEWCVDKGFLMPNPLDGTQSGYFTNVEKSQTEVKNHLAKRQISISSNISVKRSLLGGIVNDGDNE